MPNIEYVFYELEDVTEFIGSLQYKSQQNNISFGIEKIISNTCIEQWIFYNSILDYPVNNHRLHQFQGVSTKSKILDTSLAKPSFLPINIQYHTTCLFNDIDGLKDVIKDDDQLFVQMIFKKASDKIKNQLIDQYTAYLNGIDHPFRNVVGRAIQQRVIFALDSLVGRDNVRSPCEHIERKIADELFHFDIRFIYKGDNAEVIKLKLKNILQSYTFLNDFKIDYSHSTDILKKVEGRVVTKHRPVLSLSEIQSLFRIQLHNKLIPKTNMEHIEKQNQVEVVDNVRLKHLLNLLPDGVTIDNEINESLYLRLFTESFINIGLLKYGEKLNLESVEFGASLWRITFSLPDGIKLSEIKNNEENIKAITGNDYIEINKGTIPRSVSFTLPKERRTIEYLKSLLMTKDFIELSERGSLPFVVGTDEIGEPIYSDLAKIYHLLIAGSTGSGKSVFLVQMLLTFLMIKEPRELQLYLIDPKRVELKKFKDFPHVKELVYEPDEAFQILSGLVKEMERRYEILDFHDVDELSEYNKLNLSEQLPFIICVVDEFADLIMLNEDIKDLIIRLGQKARASGIHLICATQRPEIKIVCGLIKSNLPTKISFRCSSVNDYKTVFGTGQPYQLLGNGDGVIKLEGALREFQRFQGPVIHEDKVITNVTIKSIANAIEDNGIDGISIHSNNNKKNESPLEKLKTIIADTGETRISQLQREMKVRINTVQELMQDLVNEGWLIKHKAKSKGYELIVSEEELEKWKTKTENEEE